MRNMKLNVFAVYWNWRMMRDAFLTVTPIKGQCAKHPCHNGISCDLLTSATHTRALNTAHGRRTYANHRSGCTAQNKCKFFLIQNFSFGYINWIAHTWTRILLFPICLKVRFGGCMGRVYWGCGGQIWSIGRHHPLQISGYKLSGSNRGVFFPA